MSLAKQIACCAALVCLLCVLAAAQPPTAPCTIEGTVTDESTGLPVARAALIVNSVKQVNVNDLATDDAGKFALHVPQGLYSITASAKGYSRRTLTTSCGAAPQSMLRFTLSPEASITGRVTDAEGMPAPGSRITLLRTVYAGGEKRFALQGGTVAGDDGQFSIDNLAPGLYFVLATAPANTAKPAKKTGDPVYVPTYYPSALEAGSAAPIHIRGPGEVGGTDIRLQKTRAFTVSGHLLGGEIAPSVRDFIVTLLPSDHRALGPNSTIRDDKGYFEFPGVVPGSYTLVAHKVGATTPSARLRIDVGDADLENVELPLSPGIMASGAVVYEDRNQPAVASAQINVQPWDEASNALQLNVTGNQFHLDALPLGNYRLSLARLSRQSYAKTLRIDGQDVPGWIADLSSPSPHTIEIILGADAGSVSGYVRNSSGDPAPKMFVILAPAGAVPLTGPQYLTTYSDDHGRYTFTGVQPGPYKVYAWERVIPGAVQNRDVLSQFSTQSADVQVPPSGTATADVTIIPASATAAIE